MTWAEWLLQVEKIVGAWRGQQELAGRINQGDAGQLYWTAWADPGKATGFGAAVYLEPPAHLVASERDQVSRVGHAVAVWMKVLKNLGITQTPTALFDTYDATGALVLTYWAEDFYARSVEEEPAMVRKIVGRIRQLGGVWWPAGGELGGLGEAGVGVETFKVRMLDSSEDYVSPLRVIAMIRYAVEDEFGIEIKSNSPGDAKGEFGVFQWKRLGMWVAGPDHVRDALSHVMLGIRKSFRK